MTGRCGASLFVLLTLIVLALVPGSASACTFSNGTSLGKGWSTVPCHSGGGGGGRGGGGGGFHFGPLGGDDSSGSDMPSGAMDCGNGKYCSAGEICTDQGTHCIPASSERNCGGGRTCGSGQACVDQGTHCVYTDNERYCGGGHYCDEGSVCTGDGHCLLRTDERYCGSHHICSPGDACASGLCRSKSDQTYCGSGAFCPLGTACSLENTCIPYDNERYCGGTGLFGVCPAGHSCESPGRCIAATDERYCGPHHICGPTEKCASGACIPSDAIACGTGRYCESGNICTRDGCLPQTSARVCRDQLHFCPEDHHCTDAMKCRADAVVGEKAAEAASQKYANNDPYANTPGVVFQEPQGTIVAGAAKGAFAKNDPYSANNPFAPSSASPAPSGSSAGDSRNIPSPCEDLTGQGACPHGGRMPKSVPRNGTGASSMEARPQQPKPPNTQLEVRDHLFKLAALFDEMAADNPDRAQTLAVILRIMTDNGLKLSLQDLECLQTDGTGRPKLISIPLRWRPVDIEREAMTVAGLCQTDMDADALAKCHQDNYGKAVMVVEPDIAGQCRGAGDEPSIEECARRKFENAWASENHGILKVQPLAQQGLDSPCRVTITAGQAPNPKSEAEILREKYKRALQKAEDDAFTKSVEPDPPVTTTKADQPGPVADVGAGPEPPPPSDDAYARYMNGDSTNHFRRDGTSNLSEPGLQGLEPTPSQRRDIDSVTR